MKWISLFFAAGLLASCSSVSSLTESSLTPGYCEFRPPEAQTKEFTKVYVVVREDSLLIIPIDNDGKSLIPIIPAHNQVFRKPSFDIDVLIVPFKYRPSSYNFPSQLTTDFNGNIFLGYRIDKYKSNFTQTPGGMAKTLRHSALTIGVFGGFGTSFISPWTTNYRTTDEYSGFILSRGVSAMIGISNLTVGVGVGWDFLTDRDKDIWIYQNTPWYGLMLSLNLN